MFCSPGKMLLPLSAGGAIESGPTPAFALDFTQGALDSRVTFSRASSGTYIDSDGWMKEAAVDQIRFQHDPVTGERLGFLCEEQRTNQARNSGSVTGITNCTVDSTTEPGMLPGVSANLVRANAVSGIHIFFPGGNPITSGLTYTFTEWIAVGSANLIQLTGSSAVFGTTAYANFSLVGDGSITASADCVARIGKPIKGYYPCSITLAAISSAGSPGIICAFIPDAASGRLPSYTASNETVRHAGFQVEEGLSPSSYIPTADTAVTRSRDIAQISGTDFSSWFTAGPGTIFAEGSYFKASVARATMFSIDDEIVNNRVQLRENSGNSSGIAVSSGVTLGAINGPAMTASIKQAYGFADASYAYADNGVLRGTASTAGALPAVTGAGIGFGRGDFNTVAHCLIKRVAYYNSRLTDAQLVALTA